MSAIVAWETLKLCWIDTYLGPLDIVVYDAGKNFALAEVKRIAKAISINIKEVPVEAHNSVGLVERYYALLRRAFEIFREDGFNKEIALQMAVKAVNDSAGPDGLVPTLLVFGTYPRMVDQSPPSLSIATRAESLRKATQEVRKLYAERKIQDALEIRNSLNVTTTLQLLLQLKVRV